MKRDSGAAGISIHLFLRVAFYCVISTGFVPGFRNMAQSMHAVAQYWLWSVFLVQQAM